MANNTINDEINEMKRYFSETGDRICFTSTNVQRICVHS